MKKSGFDTTFRSAMLYALSAVQTLKKQCNNPIDLKVYIASGFYNMNVKSYATDVLNFIDSKTTKSLQNLLSNLDVEIFGAYSSPKDLQKIKSALSSVASSVHVYYKYRFHSKLFAIVINNNPFFEIIGSSNITIPAYEGLQYSKKGVSSFSLNTETDLILYNDDLYTTYNQPPIDLTLEPNENIMQLSYDEKMNTNITLQNRMVSIVNYFSEIKKGMKELT